MSIASRTPHVRRSNLALVIDRLRRFGPSTRSQLVASTGLTRSAIAGLVGELESLRLVIEEPSGSDGRPGRPSPSVRIDDRAVTALAIEIFVDEVAVAVVGLDGTVAPSVRVERPRSRVTVDETLGDVARLVERVATVAQRGGEPELIGCGVSVPGLVRGADGVVLTAPNLGWGDVPLGSLIQSMLEPVVGQLEVRIGNDADLGALAESRFGAGAGSDHMLFVSGEVGVGGGLIVGGVPVVGHLGFAGEIGHVPVNPHGRPCACGSIGCWETEVGERALLERAGFDPDGGRSAVDELIDRAGNGDPVTLESLAIEARWLAIGITGLVNVLDLDTIVLGGLFARLLPTIRTQLDDELEQRRYRAASRRVAVVGASLGSSAVTVGAGELAFGPLLDDPARVMTASVRRRPSRQG